MLRPTGLERGVRRHRRWRPSAIAGAVAVLLATGCTSFVNRAAFQPDPEDAVADGPLPANVRRVVVPTVDGEQLEGFVVGPEHVTRLVLYFHGNAGNVTQRLPQMQTFADRTGATVLGIGYRGYGASTGRPSEPGIYRDGEAALRYAEKELAVTESRIFVCGVSLGTTVAVDVAQGRALAGVILVSPLTSGRELARDHHRGSLAWIVGGAFDSLAKVPHLRSPVLVIHGTDDQVIPYRRAGGCSRRSGHPSASSPFRTPAITTSLSLIPPHSGRRSPDSWTRLRKGDPEHGSARTGRGARPVAISRRPGRGEDGHAFRISILAP